MIEHFHNIPEEMKEYKQWLVWRSDKAPRKAYGHSLASATNPDDWVSYDEAIASAIGRPGTGIGFVLTQNDPYVSIDLDHCLSNGEIGPRARDIFHEFNTYTEVSPSGTGLHLWGKIDSKNRPNCRDSEVEIYTQGHYLTMTGNLFPNSVPWIQPVANEFDTLYNLIAPKTEPTPQVEIDDIPEDASSMSDMDLLSLMVRSPKCGANIARLWSGDASAYRKANGDPNLSSADIALCNYLAFYTGKDADRMDRMFRLSGLYRQKWERPDYRQWTINEAIAKCHNTYAKPKKRGRPAKSAEMPTSSPIKSLTDLGNAEYLVDLNRDTIRYDVDSGRWLHWNGTYWQRDDTGKIDRLARETVRGLYDVLKTTDDPDRSKALFAHIKKSEQRPRLEAIVALARHTQGVPVKVNDLDANHWVFNCPNGTVDLRTGQLRQHNPADMITKTSPVEYNPKAKCPRWIQFLQEVFQGDTDLINFVQRMVGYCLAGDTREESIFILYGRGQCGKSKFMDTLRHILGDYIKDTPVTTFTERNDTNTADLAALVGSRLVTASEAEDKQAFNEPLLKRISGRDPITCRFLYKDYFTYVPTFKVLFATNDVPNIKSQSFAMKRRIKLVPFKQRFHDPEDGIGPVKDDQIGEKLLAESEGILAWCVQGCLQWQKCGLQVPVAVKREVNALFDSLDPLGEFIDLKCQLDDDAMIAISELWRAYLAWCETDGRRPAFKQTNWFSRNLTQRDGIEAIRGVDGSRMLQGITLKSDALTHFGDGSVKSLHDNFTLSTLPNHLSNASMRQEDKNISIFDSSNSEDEECQADPSQWWTGDNGEGVF